MAGSGILERVAADVGGVVRFFSRLPVPRLGPADDPASLPDFRTAAWAIPLAGAILALPAALLAALLALSALPPLAAGALVVAASALVTGALHEDGLADTADGLAGGHDRARRLEIMKDSRIGVFGAAALCLVLVARASLAGALVAAGPAEAAAGVLLAAVAGRAAMTLAWIALPPARPGGLAAAAGRPGGRAAVLASASAVALAALAATAGGFGAPALVLGSAVAALAALAIGVAARRCIGGQTGDILGAVEQLAGLGFLVGLLA